MYFQKRARMRKVAQERPVTRRVWRQMVGVSAKGHQRQLRVNHPSGVRLAGTVLNPPSNHVEPESEPHREHRKLRPPSRAPVLWNEVRICTARTLSKAALPAARASHARCRKTERRAPCSCCPFWGPAKSAFKDTRLPFPSCCISLF